MTATSCRGRSSMPTTTPVLCQEALAKRDALIQKLGALPPVQSALDQIIHRFGHDAVAEITGRSRRVLRIEDARGERLALRSRPASANLAETAAFMDGEKRILVFSMAGGIGRSYHADLGCANTERRTHYLLEPGWRADQAIQGLGRTHRTHQASAPLFRPVATDVKGERRFIATIARRLDSLGAITRGQRDSQTAMGGDDTALFRASDNLESLYAKSALRQFYIALWRGHIEGWSLKDFEEATGLKLTWEGNLKEDLPPMPQFLNRLLALPIDEQNQLFSALETRIEANIEIAVEAGTFERGVETIVADSLSVASRETVFTHEGSGAETEIVEIARKDRLEPLGADAAIELHAATSGKPPLLMVNGQSKRAALVMDAPARTLDDGDVQERVRLVRPAVRETMARAALDASQWRPAGEDRWRALWDAEIAGLPSHRESRFWLVAGLLLPIWDRLPDESMRVRRLLADDGEHLIGRVLGPAEVSEFRIALGLDGGLWPDRCRGPRRDHEAGRLLPTVQRLEARTPPPHGSLPHRDRGSRGRRHRHAQAHGMHRRDRLMAHPPVRARPRHPGAHHGSLAHRGAAGVLTDGLRRRSHRQPTMPPASVRAAPPHRNEDTFDDHARASRGAGVRLHTGLRAARPATADPHRLRGDGRLRPHGIGCAHARRCRAALRSPQPPPRARPRGLVRHRRALHGRRPGRRAPALSRPLASRRPPAGLLRPAPDPAQPHGTGLLAGSIPLARRAATGRTLPFAPLRDI